MIVDDSSLSAGKISKMIENSGHTVVKVCENGQEAIRAYAEVAPDVVTMDISMPDMNGVEATKEIVKLNENAIIVMVTAIGQEQMVIEAVEAGAKGYLLKPIREENLIETIERVYDRYVG